jgi:hypothetical protein
MGFLKRRENKEAELDKTDRPVLAGRARLIVTGDSSLQELADFLYLGTEESNTHYLSTQQGQL